MHVNIKRLNSIKNKDKEILTTKQLKTNPKIIAVSKTFSANQISPLLDIGHIHFGENKIQEAEEKWFVLRSKYKNTQLHMIGKLQSNKAKKAVRIFDYIHSVDNAKLASKIAQFEKELNKKVKLFIQVNVGGEVQKSGISLNDLVNFYKYCVKDLSLDIVGLMCLPPNNPNTEKYFQLLKNSSDLLKLKNLSMGMSKDYEQALLYGATHLRIGSAIFGDRVV